MLYTENGTKYYRDGAELETIKNASEKTYDGLDRLTHEEYGENGSIEKDYTYVNNLDGTTTDLISSETFSGGATFSYTYDAMGRILTVSENNVLKISYTYDSLGQLVREDNAYTNFSNTWEYDGNGNITSRKMHSYTTGTLGTPFMPNTFVYGDSEFKDLITSYNGTIIQHDASGNPTSWRGSVTAMTWSGNRLESVTPFMTTQYTTYTYNSSGIRTSKTIGTDKTVEYLLDGTKIIKQTTKVSGSVTEELIFYYDTNEELIGFHYNGHDYFYGKDCTGIIRYIYGENGDIIVTYYYDAWGNVTVSGTSASTIGKWNPFRYREYYYDIEIGLNIFAKSFRQNQTAQFTKK